MTKGKVKLKAFAWSFTYYIGNHKELVTLDKKLNPNYDSSNTEIYLSWVIKEKRILFLNEEADLSTRIHEIIHLKNLCFKYIGQELDVDNDEFECYLADWLTSEIHKALEKHKLKKEKV